MTPRNLAASLATVTLTLAACGGSDGDDSSGASPFGDSDGDSTLSDEVDQVLEDNGIDVGGLIDDDGEVDLDQLDDIQSDASDAIESLSNASGSATFTIDGAPYQVEGATCFVFGDDLSLEGAGTTPDGQPFWGSVSYTLNNRAEMAESGLFDEAFLDQMFGDRTEAVDLSVSVEVGKTEMFGSAPDGNPEFGTDIFMDEPFFGALAYEKSGSSISGTGDIIDEASVVAEYGELIPFSFDAACS